MSDTENKKGYTVKDINEMTVADFTNMQVKELSIYKEDDEIIKKQEKDSKSSTNKIEIDTKKYRPYKQNQVIDNTIRELTNYKQLDIFDNAISINKSRSSTFELTIERYTELEEYLSKELYSEGKANQSAGKLLDSFLIAMAQEGFNTSTAVLPLKEYAELTGRKDMKELRKRTRADMEILKRIKIREEPRNKSSRNTGEGVNTYLFGGTEGIKNGKIIFKFNEDFFRIFAGQRNYLYMPVEALQSNERKNPHTYLLYKKVISHKRINAGKPRENKIKVKELYDFCVTLPRYEEVMKTTRQTDKRIIEPFERDLSVINEFSWHYETEEPPKDFKEWLNTYIIITWNNDQPGIEDVIKGREKQQKRVEKAKQKALEKIEKEKLKNNE